jgi:hypothetical protein
MSFLAGKPEKWDAADADPAERKAILAAVIGAPPKWQGQKPFRILDWTTQDYMGVPPPIEWLVNEVIPIGAAGMLAAAGGTGKGLLILDMALKIAADPPPGMDFSRDHNYLAFGCRIMRHGRVVVLHAEDNKDEVHRRLAAIDPAREMRKRAGNRLHVIPLPNAGGVKAMFESRNGNPVATEFFWEFRDQLMAMADLMLTVIDPMACFAHLDINADPQAAAYVMNMFAMLATEAKCAILIAHHMGKGDAKKPISTAEEARGMVRGSGALVDGLRFVYALWPMDESRATRRLKAIGIPFERNRVFEGAVVKANGPMDPTIRTYLRNKVTGLLEDVTQRLSLLAKPKDELEDSLLEEIRLAALENHPFMKTSASHGLHARRTEMRKSLEVGAKRLKAMADSLLDDGRVVMAYPVGRAGGVMDVPDGPYATGQENRVSREARPVRADRDM